MITKGIIEAIDGYKATVRLPIFDGIEGTQNATAFADLSVAPACTLPNVSNIVSVGDIVYVAFEDNDIGQPVIIGHLYTENGTETKINLDLGSLTTSLTSKLSDQTYIGDVSPNEIKSLTGIKSNIQTQIDLVNDNLTVAKSELTGEIDTVADNLENVAGDLYTETNRAKNTEEDLQDQIDTIKTTDYADTTDNDFVHKTGTETITGTKTFSSSDGINVLTSTGSGGIKYYSTSGTTQSRIRGATDGNIIVQAPALYVAPAANGTHRLIAKPNSDSNSVGGVVYSENASYPWDIGTSAKPFNNIYATNIYSTNSTYTQTNVEQVYSSNSFIYLRDGATKSLASEDTPYSGIQIVNYDGANTNFNLIVDSTGTVRAGDEGDEQPLALRDEASNMLDDVIVYWDKSNLILKNDINHNYIALSDGVNTRKFLYLYDDGDSSNWGSELVLTGGGNTFISSGEAASLLRTQFQSSSGLSTGETYSETGEQLYIASDYSVYLYSNAQTIGNRLGIVYDSSGNLRPLVTGTRQLGTSSYYWNAAYINSITATSGGFTSTTDISGIASTTPPLYVGTLSGTHLEFDANEIMAKASATTAGTLYLNYDGGNVSINGSTAGNVTGKFNLYPAVTNTYNLGTSSYKWKNLYLSGNLSNGTASVSLDEIPYKYAVVGIDNNSSTSTWYKVCSWTTTGTYRHLHAILTFQDVDSGVNFEEVAIWFSTASSVATTSSGYMRITAGRGFSNANVGSKLKSVMYTDGTTVTFELWFNQTTTYYKHRVNVINETSRTNASTNVKELVVYKYTSNSQISESTDNVKLSADFDTYISDLETNYSGITQTATYNTYYGNVLPYLNNTYDLGLSSLKWSNVWATTFNGDLSGNADTATKVYQTISDTASDLPMLFAGSISTSSGSDSVYKASDFYYNPSTKTLTVDNIDVNDITVTGNTISVTTFEGTATSAKALVTSDSNLTSVGANSLPVYFSSGVPSTCLNIYAGDYVKLGTNAGPNTTHYGIAIGYNATAAGYYGIAVGEYATASQVGAIAIGGTNHQGYLTTASGRCSIAIGTSYSSTYYTHATADSAIQLGCGVNSTAGLTHGFPSFQIGKMLLLKPTNTTSVEIAEYTSSTISYDVGTDTFTTESIINAPTFIGALSGNATSADKVNETLTLTLNGAISDTTYDGSTARSYSWYAPTSAGTSNYVLTSKGSGAPGWTAQSSLSVGSATTATQLSGTYSSSTLTFNVYTSSGIKAVTMYVG